MTATSTGTSRRPDADPRARPAGGRARARRLARKAGAPVVKLAQTHTTVSVERALLRLAGLSGADHERVPWVNHLVDAVRDAGRASSTASPCRSGTRCAAARRRTC